ncbi:hypothetical protein H0A36_27345 [Endozoicomonas sp. SM1973]|uniref:Uncharacterized protein n=1 Tax=Spartinivicinus marinus TaxID=2994442 RepID=A0A853II48_9GAMM|nr:hypothetical protein [Spartinivicinus marinus]NYZ69731.1 hypothetical protein [Spartinivicinus marinus]
MGVVQKNKSILLSYEKFVLPRLLPFSISRILPFITTFILTVVLANKSISGLAIFGYIMSMFMVATTLLTMPLAIVGNFAAKSSSNEELSSLFTSGAVLSIGLSIAATVINLIIYQSIFKSSPLYDNNPNVDHSAYIYLAAVFLLGINTFLFTFLEAKDCQKKVAKAKAISSSLSVAYITISIYIYNTDSIIVAFSSFLVTEVSILFLLLVVTRSYSKSIDTGLLSLEHKKIKPAIIINILKVGMPIAAGLTIQKLVFFLLNERLSNINESFVAILSIFGSITTLLLIPIVSYSQANSLFVSTNSYKKYKLLTSIKFLSAVILGVLVIGYISSPYIFSLFNIKNIDSNTMENLFASIAIFVTARAFLAYTTSSLRGIHDTFIPQVCINFTLTAVFIPLIWTKPFNDASFEEVINVQSTLILICSSILFVRLYCKFKGKKNA